MKGNQKQLNLFDIFSIGLGGAIGSGIFVLMGVGIGYTGHSVFISLVLGCIIMLLAYMYNVVLVSMFPFKGGTYSQSALLFSPTMTGVNAIFLLLVGFSLSIYSSGIVSYIAAIIPGITAYSKLVSVAIMTLFFAITIKGSKFLAMIQNIMTVILLLSIGIFIILGIPKVQSGFFDPSTFFKNGAPGFLCAVSIMGFACQGTTGGIAMTSVTKKPTKTIPFAILLVTLVLAVIYALMGIVSSGVLPVEKVAGQPLSAVAAAIFPHWFTVVFIIGGAVFALTTSLLASIASLNYPISQIAEDGWLPKCFTKKTKGGYPWATQLTFYIISLIPILTGISFEAIVSLVMIPTMLITLYCNIKCISIPKKYPEQWKKSILHMPMPLYTAIMILGAAADLFIAYNLLVTLKPIQMLYVALAFGFCIVLAIIRVKTKAVDVNKLMEIKKTVSEEAANT